MVNLNVGRLKSLEEILIEDSTYQSNMLRKRLLKDGILEEKCSCCGLGNIWNNIPITLQLDHINGKHKDNRLLNLRLLCPNCHSQTNTFSGRNQN